VTFFHCLILFYIFTEVKFLSLIFAFYIGGIIIQPSLSVLINKIETQEVCDDQCCSNEGSCDSNGCDDQKNNDCCPSGICNPFESCACCVGFSITKPIIGITSNDVNVNYSEPEIKKVHYGFSSDCFHPPEIV